MWHFLHHDGLIDGYPDDTFRPANPVNRAEFIKMVVEAVRRLDGIDAYAGELPSFIDPNQWYSFYMATAYNMKNPKQRQRGRGLLGRHARPDPRESPEAKPPASCSTPSSSTRPTPQPSTP